MSKRCTKCGLVKLLSEYSRQAQGVMGRKSECKTCQVIANKEYRHNTHKTLKAVLKRCSICRTPLTAEQQVAERQRIKGTINLPRCPDCRYLSDNELARR